MTDDRRSGELWVVAAAVSLIALAFAAYQWLNAEREVPPARPAAPRQAADSDG